MSKANECPQCFTGLPPEAMQALQEDDVPQVGDFSLCGTCGSFLVITSVRPFVFRAATEAESTAYAKTDIGRAALELLAEFREWSEKNIKRYDC